MSKYNLDQHYLYDVAFSFLAQDEYVALKLHNLVKDSLKSFIYSEEQKKLAGTDGEKTFKTVFNMESRIVVILYRSGWGETTWTRFEEEAIRNRAYDNGYDFTIWIPLDAVPTLPIYVPKNRLYAGLDRWGYEGIAAIIEARVNEFGGYIKPKTNATHALSANNAIKRKAKREAIRAGSSNEVEISLNEFKQLVGKIEAEVQQITENAPAWTIKTRPRDNGVDVISYGYQLVVQASYFQFEPHVLSIHMYRGVWSQNGNHGGYPNPKIIFGKQYLFDLDDNDIHGWSDKTTGRDFVTTNKLAVRTIEQFIDKVRAGRLKSNL